MKSNQTPLPPLARWHEHMTGVHLVTGGRPAPVEVARALLGAGIPFVWVADSLPAAVSAREQLAPSPEFDASGLPITEHADSGVGLYRAHAGLGHRLELLRRHGPDDLVGLIVTPQDLEIPGTLRSLSRRTDLCWIVEGAYKCSVLAAEFDAAFVSLRELALPERSRALWLFLPPVPRPLLLHLRESFQVPDAHVHLSASPALASIDLSVEPAPHYDRARLREVLHRHLANAHNDRGVVVAPLERDGVGVGQAAVPASELTSIAAELGVRPACNPGEDLDAEVESWARLFHHPVGLLLSADSAPLHVFPPGARTLLLRLFPPQSLAQVFHEVTKIDALGGGEWAYLGPLPDPDAHVADESRLERLLHVLLEVFEPRGAPVYVDAEQLAARIDLPTGPLLPRSAETIARFLELFVGVGFLKAVHRVSFELHVADAHRFALPHVREPAPYLEFYEAYQAALARASLADAVRLKLSAGPPRDLRTLAKRLDMPVSKLNEVFSDLATDRLVIGRLVTSGAQGNLNFEVVFAGERRPSEDDTRAVIDALKSRGAFLRADQLRVLQLLRACAADPGHASDALREMLDECLHVDAADGSIGPERLPSSPLSPPDPGVVTAPESRPSLAEAPESAAPPTGRVHPEGDARDENVAEAPGGAAESPADGSPVSSADAGGDEPPPSPAWTAFERFLSEPAPLVSRDAVVSLHALARRLEREGAVPRALERLGADGEPSVVGRALRIALLERIEGDEQIVDEIILWMELAPEEERRMALPSFVAGLDYHIALVSEGDGAEGEEVVDACPPDLERVLLALPLVENGDSRERAFVLDRAGWDGVVVPEGLGAHRLERAGRMWRVRRRLYAPELEARLWLAIDSRGDLPSGIVFARLADVYSMIDGPENGELSAEIEERLCAKEDEETWLPPSRHHLALARACSREGQKVNEALRHVREALKTLEGPTRVEALVMEARLLEQLGEPLAILEKQGEQGGEQSRSLRLLWEKAAKALGAECAARDCCADCRLHGTVFCPAPSAFWDFLERNPFGEGVEALNRRLEKRLIHDLTPGGPREIARVLDGVEGEALETRLMSWLGAGLEGDVREWLDLAKKLAGCGRRDAALEALRRVDEAVGEGSAEFRRERVELWIALDRVERAVEEWSVRDAQAASLDDVWFGRRLARLWGAEWFDELDALSAGWKEENVAILRRVAASWGKGQRERRLVQSLKDALRRADWARALEARNALRGEEAVSRRATAALEEAERRIEGRKAQLNKRIGELLGLMKADVPQPMLDRLVKEAEVLGLDELVARVRERREALSARHRARGGRRNEQEAGRRERRRGGRSSGKAGKARGGDEAGAGRHGADDRGREDNARRARKAEEVAKAREAMKTLLEAIRSADSDSFRRKQAIRGLEQSFSHSADSGLRFLKDVLPLFSDGGVLDAPLSSMVQRGTPKTKTLARFRKVIEDLGMAERLPETMAAIELREHPEPWKAILSRIRLSSGR